MNPSEANWPARIRSLGLLKRWLLLSIVVLVLFGLVGSVNQMLHGLAGWKSAAAAAGLCWAGASIALILSGVCSNALVGMLSGMVFRMALPLVVGFKLNDRLLELREADFLMALAAMYLATLPVETWLSLPVVERRSAATVSTPRLQETAAQ